MEYSNSNHVESMSAAGSARIQIGNNSTVNNTTNNYSQDDDERYLAALCLTDPRHDKIRIEETNGGLLKDSYSWVLQSPEYQRWRDPKENCPLLWIRGDPGKGKTMLLSGIINELEAFTRLGDPETDKSLSYFFCQATNPGLNNSVAVLRGLAYLLLEQQPCLRSNLRGKSSLNPEHWNSGVAIRDVLSKILRDSALQNVIFVVDALDECVTDLKSLLNFINSTTSTHVRWIVSSRNICEIGQGLQRTRTKLALSLELNAESVSQAVNYYIEHRVHDLGVTKAFRSDDLRSAKRYLSQNADGTFLWVALVCQQLERSDPWEVKDYLKLFPPGLSKLYERMVDTIRSPVSSDLYIRILAIISTVYRPISLSELMAIQNIPGDEEMLPEMIMKCGCFLTLRDNIIYFVHQSAKDFLAKQQDILFPCGLTQCHLGLFDACLNSLDVLEMDIYGQLYPGVHLGEALHNCPEPDPLSGLSYSCEFWAHHVHDAQPIHAQDLSYCNKAHHFIADKFLFWLEALSLLQSLPAAMETLKILKDLPLGNEAMALVEDARRFFLCFQSIIEHYPLQTYASGLLFSPEKSLIRRHFEHCSPKFVVKKPKVDAQWRPFLSITKWECDAIFSADNKSLVTANFGQLIKFNVSDGMESMYVDCPDLDLITPSHDMNWFAGATTRWPPDHPQVHIGLQVRSLESNRVKWSTEFENRVVRGMKFSPDSRWLAVCFNEELFLLELETNICRRWPLKISRQPLRCVIEFSSDGALVAILGTRHWPLKRIVVVDVRTGEQHRVPNAETARVESAVFSPDTHGIMMCWGGNLWHWDIIGKKCHQLLEFDGDAMHIASSHGASWIAVASDSEVFLYGKQNKELLQRFEVPSLSIISSLAVSFDDQRLAVSCIDDISLWDVSSLLSKQTYCDGGTIKSTLVSDNGRLMAWAVGRKIQVWDATTGNQLAEFDMRWCSNSETWDSWPTADSAAFSTQGHLLVASASSRLFVWDLSCKMLLHEIGVPDSIDQLAVSPGGQWVAVITTKRVYFWDATTMRLRWSLKRTGSNFPISMHLSDANLVIIWSPEDNPCLMCYDVTNGTRLAHFGLLGSGSAIEEFALSPNGQRAAWLPSLKDDRIIFISQEKEGIRRASLIFGDPGEYRFSFVNDSSVLTERGMFNIEAILTQAATEPNSAHRPTQDIPTFDPCFSGCGFNVSSYWITLDGYPLLWLPLQYRQLSDAPRFAMGEHHIAVHCFAGVFFIQFSQEARDLLRHVCHKRATWGTWKS